jgi:uncharacterized iron-regulated membrane protein
MKLSRTLGTSCFLLTLIVAMPALSQDAVGIPACDTFLTKFDACMKAQPGTQSASRAQFDQMIQQMRTSWKQMAANPQAKTALETSCQQMTEQMKVTLNAAPYNCGL